MFFGYVDEGLLSLQVFSYVVVLLFGMVFGAFLFHKLTKGDGGL